MTTVLPRPGQNGDPEEVFEPAMQAWVNATTAFSAEMNVFSGTVASSVAAVQAGLLADPFNPATNYASGARAFSLLNGFLFRRKSSGTNATDPSEDPTNWDPQTLMGFPIVIVNTSTHTIAPNTAALIVYPGQCTLTPDAAATEFAVKRANGRLDNVLQSSEPIEGQADSIYLDGPWSDGPWRYWSATYGYGRA